jgi:hypothetical protein
LADPVLVRTLAGVTGIPVEAFDPFPVEH